MHAFQEALPKFNFYEAAHSIWQAKWELLLPVVSLVALFNGWATPVEAAALTKAAALLKNCQANWNAPDRERSLAEALEFNQKLWCIFQASLAAHDHPLPAVLRQDVLRLGIFIDKRIFEVMAYPAPEKLKTL